MHEASQVFQLNDLVVAGQDEGARTIGYGGYGCVDQLCLDAVGAIPFAFTRTGQALAIVKEVSWVAVQYFFSVSRGFLRIGIVIDGYRTSVAWVSVSRIGLGVTR